MNTLKLLTGALRFSKKIIILSVGSVLVFTVAMSVMYVYTGSVPDTLITEFIGFFRLEGGTLGLIKVAETIVKIFTKTEDSGDTDELDGNYPEIKTIDLDGKENNDKSI